MYPGFIGIHPVRFPEPVDFPTFRAELKRMAKKNPLKSSFLLLIVAAGALALTWWVLKPQHEAREKRKENAQLLWSDTDRAKVLEFKTEGPSGALHIKRKADKADEWLVSGNGKTFEADRGTVDGVISTILAAKKENPLGGTPNLKDLGLEPAKYKLSFGTQQARELWLGEDTPVDYLVYAKWSDSPEVFLTSRSIRFGIDKKMSELRNKRAFNVSLSELKGVDVVVSGADKVLDKAKLSFALEEGKGWKLVGGPKALSVDSAELDRWFNAITGTMAAGFASDDAKEKTKYGFQSPLATLTFTPKDGKPAAVWMLGSVTEGSGKDRKTKLYLTREGDDSTFEVADAFKDHFKVTSFRFRPKDVVRFAKADVTGLALSDGKDSLELVKEGAEWKIKGAPAKTENVDKLLDGLTGLKVTEYLETANAGALGFNKPARTVEVRGLKDGKAQTLAFVVFGKTQAKGVPVRTESMEAAGLVAIDLNQAVPLTAEAYGVTAPAAAPTPAPATNPGAIAAPTSKGQKVKLEPTVASPKEVKKLPSAIVKPGHKYSVEITMAKGGKIVIEMAADKAPYTVSNFLNLARNKFYDGVTFHRVIKDFMAQGGDPEGKGYGGPGYKFDDEQSGLPNVRAAISMANAGPNTNGSQFFIIYRDQPHLNGKHTVFGKVVSGMEVVDAIQGGDIMKTVEAFEESK